MGRWEGTGQKRVTTFSNKRHKIFVDIQSPQNFSQYNWFCKVITTALKIADMLGLLEGLKR